MNTDGAVGEGLGTYLMNMTSQATGQVSSFKYKLLKEQTKTESVAYFVLEHQPNNCEALPPNGNVTWTNIQVEVNGVAVESPVFTAQQEEPACHSKAVVINSTSIAITWTP